MFFQQRKLTLLLWLSGLQAILCTQHRHLQYDYRKLCNEILANCKYESITLNDVTVQSLSHLLDKKENDNNEWIVEVKSQLPPIRYKEIDAFLTPR